jgi:hypothetical protein
VPGSLSQNIALKNWAKTTFGEVPNEEKQSRALSSMENG